MNSRFERCIGIDYSGAQTPFDELNGNIQGFASGREIAVNPVAGLPHKTTLHELAHLCCVRSYVALSREALWLS